MADEGEYLPEPQAAAAGSPAKWIALLLGVLYVAGSLYFLFNLRERIDQLDKSQTASNAQLTDLTKRIQAADADTETLAKQLGMTKKELDKRSQQLQREQQTQRETQA